MTSMRCPKCRRDAADDGLLCDDCTGRLRDALDRLERLAPELTAVVVREEQVARANWHPRTPWRTLLEERSEERAVPARLRSESGRIALPATPLPVNLDAAALVRKTARLVREWDLELGWQPPARERGVPGPVCAADVCAHDSCRAIRASQRRAAQRSRPGQRLASVAASVQLIRQQPPQVVRRLVAQICGLAGEIERAVDMRVAEVFVGPCDAVQLDLQVVDGADGGEVLVVVDAGQICSADLFCSVGDEVVRCPECGAEYPVAARREWLLEAARDCWARPAVIAEALAKYAGVEFDVNRLDQWISRDRRMHAAGREHPLGYPLVLQVGIDSDEVDPVTKKALGKPLYRIGDVMDRLLAVQADQQRQQLAGRGGREVS